MPQVQVVSRAADILHRAGILVRDTDLERERPPRRVRLSEHALARQLGLGTGDIRAYLRSRMLHEATRAEERAKLGLVSEELAALAVVSWLMREHGLTPKVGPRFLHHLIGELLQATAGQRVLVFALRGNRGRMRVWSEVGQGPIEIDPAHARYTTALDATWLRDRIEEAMATSPLRVPAASSAVVSR